MVQLLHYNLVHDDSEAILSQKKYKMSKSEKVLAKKQREKILATCSQHLTWFSFRNMGDFSHVDENA